MIRLALASCLALLATLGLATAQGLGVSSLNPPATTQDITAALQQQMTKMPAVPTSGPGAGLCRATIVPSQMVTSGGVQGTAGTCTRILQCGTAPDYVVTQFNVGGGC